MIKEYGWVMMMYMLNHHRIYLFIVIVVIIVPISTKRISNNYTTTIPVGSMGGTAAPLDMDEIGVGRDTHGHEGSDDGSDSRSDDSIGDNKTKKEKRAKKVQDDCSIDSDSENGMGEKKSFLWTLPDREAPVYFYGTIHVPYTQVWKHIPENVKKSFHRADQIHFELDLMDPNTVSTLAKCQLLPQGEYLSNVIPSELYRRLKRHLNYVKDMMPSWMTTEQQGRGLYADYLFNAITGNWERKRPIWVMLMVNSLTESDIKARGIPVLDLYLAQEARRLGKTTGGVEQVAEQCLPLNELNFTQVLFALNQTLREHEDHRDGTSNTQYTTDDLIHHYNCGQLDNVLISHDTAQVPNLVYKVNTSLPSSDLVIARDIDQYFRQELIYKRNYRMANRIIRLLRNHPNDSFFFAFGAGHMIGNNTVLDILQRKGYNIQNTSPNAKAYLGKDYVEQEYLPLLADIDSTFPVPSVMINGNLEYLDPLNSDRKHRQRHRHNRRKNRKGRNRDRHKSTSEEEESSNISSQRQHHQQPKFKDLWVRLEPTSTKSHSYLRLQDPLLGVMTASPSVPVTAHLTMYNSATASSSSLVQTCTLFLFLSTIVIHLLETRR